MRNFSFNPDTGTVTAVQYDELGFPSIPESWVMLWEADVQSVQDLRDGRLTLKPRAQPFLLSNGAVGRFVSGALVRFWPSPLGIGASGNALNVDRGCSAQNVLEQSCCKRLGDVEPSLLSPLCPGGCCLLSACAAAPGAWCLTLCQAHADWCSKGNL